MLVVIGALAMLLAPMVEHSSTQTLKRWFRYFGFLSVSASVLITVVAGGYEALVHLNRMADYEAKVREFQGKAPLLQQAFPLIRSDRSDHTIVNLYEAEVVLRRLGYSEDELQSARSRFLASPAAVYPPLRFAVRNPAMGAVTTAQGGTNGIPWRQEVDGCG